MIQYQKTLDNAGDICILDLFLQRHHNMKSIALVCEMQATGSSWATFELRLFVHFRPVFVVGNI